MLNSPSPVPYLPHFVMKLPSLSNFCIRLLPLSVTYTYPKEESTEIPQAWSNCPSPVPYLPQFAIKVTITVKLLYSIIK